MFLSWQDRLTASYSTFAYVNQPAVVAPVGEAFSLTGTNRAVLYGGKEDDILGRL